jgi:HD superfamily phosphodiesterase
MKNLAEIYNLNPDLFTLNDSQFDHKSRMHGADHTYRVMTHALLIGINEDLKQEARIAFFAAYIHDLARKHDGKCLTHGKESAREKLPKFTEFFQSQGVSFAELSSIATAVTFHSKSHEIDNNHPDYIYTAILKDADALDRVRLGYFEPDENFLRFPKTKKLITFAHCYYENTPKDGFSSFADSLNLAEDLLRTNTYLLS